MKHKPFNIFILQAMGNIMQLKMNKVSPSVSVKTAIVGLICLFATPVVAQTAAPTTEIGMYGFLPSISGTSQLGTVTSDIDVPFKTLLENLDIGFAGYINHRRGKWSFIGDVSYSKLSTGGNIASTPTLSLSVDAEIKQMWAAGYVGYQVYEQKYGDAMLGIDVLAGLRYNKLDVGLSANASGLGLTTSASRQRDENWIDGVIGVRGSYDFGNGWAASGWVDVGIGDDSSSYQLIANTSYTFANNIKVFGGYRLYHFEYHTAPGPTFFDIDADYSGPMVGVSYEF